MSYIRSGSNPESLYVYHDCGGFISWSLGGNKPVHIRPQDFYGLMKKDSVDAKCGQLKLEEVQVYDSDDPLDDDIVEQDRSISDLIEEATTKPSSFKIRVTHKGKLIGNIWKVTWAYMAANVVRSLKFLDKDKKRKAKARAKKKAAMSL